LLNGTYYHLAIANAGATACNFVNLNFHSVDLGETPGRRFLLYSERKTA
jgi:hypothetical protein